MDASGDLQFISDELSTVLILLSNDINNPITCLTPKKLRYLSKIQICTHFRLEIRNETLRAYLSEHFSLFRFLF